MAHNTQNARETGRIIDVTFKIERIRQHLVGHNPKPLQAHPLYEHSSKGFLVTGYADGSDWLVSPLGTNVYDRAILRHAPDYGWAIADDRRNYHRLHLYLMDIPSKTFREVEDLLLTRNYDVIGYDSERIVVVCPPASEPNGFARDMVVVDVATARIVDRFTLTGFTLLFKSAYGCTPDGWIHVGASRLDESNQRLYINGLLRIHPLTREFGMETFPLAGRGLFTISPSGRYVLKAGKTRLTNEHSVTHGNAATGQEESSRCYEQSVEVWAGNPHSLQRTLPLKRVIPTLNGTFPGMFTARRDSFGRRMKQPSGGSQAIRKSAWG